MMNILAISGSLRTVSSNTKLIQVLSALAPVGIEINIYEGIGELPHFNPDLDGDEPPQAVQEWRKVLQAADGVILSTPEYAHGVPGVLKNALDWIVSSGEFVDKPTAVISASPLATGGEKAHDSLLLTLGLMTASLIGSSKVANVNMKLAAGNLAANEELKRELQRILSLFA
ncbi:NAD(P)H-dependent oxidoreductase [Paenibacillus sp. HWE-109]|uniref:NADPH-dependent FMN reductase n=1 Tax=Paenibacillus sp. HWE-109 TaxID=1306526 RepID=UPI001EE0D142|nr:NADPH-dependent FMN reductase [Paenibacillus sp. HWE-109]UKS25752.1 NAD(P)H-dependent oxidoreductase [Paenibacillus sp. HWE-109]